MRVTTITCDQCGAEVTVVHSSAVVPGDFCSTTCVQNAQNGETEEKECPHEDNASDAVPGRSTARLVCKKCGYDREEEVA